MQTLLMIHSIVRWLIVVIAAIALVKFALGWMRGGAFKGMDRGLASGFSGLMDLQAALGLLFFLWNGFTTDIGFPFYRFKHMGIMLLAVVVGHMQARWKNAEDQVRFRNSFFMILGALALIYVGVAILPKG